MTVHVTITGNATKDADLRFTPKGDPVASFTVAVNERVRLEDGSWGDGEPTYYAVSAWNAIALGVADKVTKGSRVIVTGTLKPRVYETKEGQTRTSLDVRAVEVGLATGFQKAEATKSEPTADEWADGNDAPPF